MCLHGHTSKCQVLTKPSMHPQAIEPERGPLKQTPRHMHPELAGKRQLHKGVIILQLVGKGGAS